MIDGFTVEQSKKWSNRGASTVFLEMYYEDKVRYFSWIKYVENVFYWDYAISTSDLESCTFN